MKSLFLSLCLGLISISALADNAPVTKVLVGTKTILANKDGLSVYTFDPDTKGNSTCYGGCAKEWPPVRVENNAHFDAPYGVTTRKDGTHQLMINDSPLYLYIDDEKSGDITGDNLGFVWHLVVLK